MEDGLETAWEDAETVLAGTTDPEGWVVWDSGASCVQKADYTAIAYSRDRYRKCIFLSGDDGWAQGCDTQLQGKILFEESPASNTFSVLALNSIWIQPKAVIHSGNIGAKYASSGPWLNSNVEVSIAAQAEVKDGVQIYGDSVRVASNASVFDIFYNELENMGTIFGNETTPLELPLQTAPFALPNITPGKDPVVLKAKETMELAEGFYSDVEVKAKATLTLLGGIYHFKSLRLQSNSSLIFSIRGEIRIQDSLNTGPQTYLGPAPGSSLTAKDLKIYVGGINGDDGQLESEPIVAKIGEKNVINANIYAPNGTLRIGGKSAVAGSFTARDVIIAEKAEVRFDSAF